MGEHFFKFCHFTVQIEEDFRIFRLVHDRSADVFGDFLKKKRYNTKAMTAD